MSEIPGDVCPALLESPTAHGAALAGLRPPGAASCRKLLGVLAGAFLAHRDSSAPQQRLPRVQGDTVTTVSLWDAAPMKEPSRESGWGMSRNCSPLQGRDSQTTRDRDLQLQLELSTLLEALSSETILKTSYHSSFGIVLSLFRF